MSEDDHTAQHYNHRELYHHVLGMNARDWEAVRETAHQMMGGSPSPMWSDEQGGSLHLAGSLALGGQEFAAGGFSHDDLKDILLCPSPAAAGRLLELENDVQGSGFKNAMKHVLKKAKHVVHKASKWIGTTGVDIGRSVYKGVNEGSKQVAKVADAVKQIPTIGDYAAPIAKIAHKVADTTDKYSPLVGKALDTIEKVADRPKEHGEKAVKAVIENPEQVAKSVAHVVKTAQDTHDAGKTLDAIQSVATGSGLHAGGEMPIDIPKPKKSRKKKSGEPSVSFQMEDMKQGKRPKKHMRKQSMAFSEKKAGKLAEPPVEEGGMLSLPTHTAGSMRLAGRIDPRRIRY
jgi:cytochrome c553